MSTDRLAEHRRQSAEDLYRLGRAAAKSGDRTRARTLLRQAVDYDRDHSEAWLWLASIADNPQDQHSYLEWAVAANPANAAARRGLAILTGKLKPETIAPEGGAASRAAAPTPTPEPQTAVVRRTYTCPQCGGRLRFDPEIVDLKCENCGYVEVVAEVPLGDGEQVLDFQLPTRRAQRWANAARRFTCRGCGAHTLFPPGQASGICPFCGSAALTAVPEDAELLEPQGLIPMGMDAERARAAVRLWLGQGLFAPDDLTQLAQGRDLRPAYVPFWTFNATLTAKWQAEVEEGSGRSRRWVWRTGERASFFTNHLQPGTRALPADLLLQAGPFTLDRLLVFKPEYLAGWPAALYDISLADASLAARAAMLKAAKQDLYLKAAPGHNLRRLEVSTGSFTGQTYKFVMLPLWIGAYTYQGRTYRVLVNGQTSRVAGDKPVDWMNVVLTAIGMVLLIGLLAAVAWYILR